MKFLHYTKEQEQERKTLLLELAELHREKWLKTGDIKLLKIAAQLHNEAALWGQA